MPFGRNRESRSREAAGRRNWPEAVPRKMRGRRKDGLASSVRIGLRGKLSVTRTHQQSLRSLGVLSVTAQT